MWWNAAICGASGRNERDSLKAGGCQLLRSLIKKEFGEKRV